jgi:hypothetical protein
MAEKLNPTDVRKLASIELNLLNLAGALPANVLEGARLERGTPIHDPNGEVLFFRFPLVRSEVAAGYADAAAHAVFGTPLLAVAPHAVWDEGSLLAQAQEAYRRRSAGKERESVNDTYDELRIVAYSYPKIAVQFLKDGKELTLLECFTWVEVPRVDPKRKKMQPSNFERWSLLDDTPARSARQNLRRFSEHARRIGQAALRPASEGLIARDLLLHLVAVTRLYDTWEIHFSGRVGDHHTCFELRGQETNVWCVAASVQMLLDFYRYNYTQTFIAERLNLGTPANPNGLPYGDEADVVTELQAMSSNALTASMIADPTFADHVAELRRNRPLISFIPGHSRCVAGYTQSLLLLLAGLPGFRGLLVYDPWPPNAGVITRWENFDAQTYRFAFTARVTTI